MTVDLADEKIALGDEVATAAAMQDLLVQIERSKAAIARTADALLHGAGDQQEKLTWDHFIRTVRISEKLREHPKRRKD